MPPRDAEHLQDVLMAAGLIEQFVEGVSRNDFEHDAMRESAVIRQLEVIGEAVKRVSADFRAAHPEIPWREMAGMRDILIHAYDHVNLDEVW